MTGVMKIDYTVEKQEKFRPTHENKIYKEVPTINKNKKTGE